MRKILFAFSILAVLVSCDEDEPITPESQDPERTILVYMAAENNLSSYADDDLKEIQTASLSLTDNNQLLVYVDLPSNDQPYIARVQNGELVDSVFFEESSSADPAVLEEMLSYMRTNYKAQSYGLVLWGHASGWLIEKNEIPYAKSRAYGVDNNGRKWMNIPPMARAIANGMGSDKLKFIFADCCNFSCVESAYELRNVTDYLIGSPAEIPDAGAPYDLVTPHFFDLSDNFYEAIIDSYYDYYLAAYQKTEYTKKYYNLEYGDLAGYSVPLSAIKTSELETLAQATATLLMTIPEKVSTEGTIDMSNSVYYAIYKERYNYAFGYDMYMTLKQNTDTSAFNTWAAALENAVVYKRYSAKWLTQFSTLKYKMQQYPESSDEVCCITMFVPHMDYASTSPNWNTAIQQFQWNDVIQWQQYGW